MTKPRVFIILDLTHFNLITYTVISDKSKEDYTIWSLYLVFLGVTLPDLAFKPDSTFLPFFEGHENNAHCLAIAVNAMAGAIFAYYGEQHQRERMKEFLVVSGNVSLMIDLSNSLAVYKF